MKILFSCNDIPSGVIDGDAVIVRENYIFSFYYVVKSGCKLIETAKTIKFIKESVKSLLIFEYTDLMPRKGTQEYLSFFIGIFKKKATIDFLRNALDILLYKEDKWDVSILQSMALAEKLAVDGPEQKLSFIDFLDKHTKEYFHEQIRKGRTASEAYRIIKTKYPRAFSQSLKQFKVAFPEKSIYDIRLLPSS